MLKAFSGICLSMTVMAGCAASGVAEQPVKTAQAPSPSAARAAKLRAVLLPAPKGMSLVYGPEIGAFGSLKSTQQGLGGRPAGQAEPAGVRRGAPARPGKPGDRPRARGRDRVLLRAGLDQPGLVSIPPAAFPGPLPAGAPPTGPTCTAPGDLPHPRPGHAPAGRRVARLPDHRVGRRQERADRLGGDPARHRRHEPHRGGPGGRTPAGLLELAGLADQNLARVTTHDAAQSGADGLRSSRGRRGGPRRRTARCG